MERKTVIGGGLAGLASAILLARRGFSVRLLEQSGHLGGRAITTTQKDFRLNLGPHALYRSGQAMRMLREWGIAPAGKSPNPGSRARLLHQDKLFDFPQSLRDLVFSSFLNTFEKLDAANAFRKLQQSNRPYEGSISDWLRREVSTEKVAAMVGALIRVATYNNEQDRLSAGAALAQFQNAVSGGVLYLDGGWQTMIDTMETHARRLGVEIEKHSNASLEPGAILAIPPAQVERMTGARLPVLRPVRMACLDLGLSALPDDAALFVLGTDRPLYFSVHSESAKIAPQGQAVVHLGKYLGGHPARAAEDRAELEALADLAMPGWRDRVVVERYLPDMTVAHSAPWVFAPRPKVDEIAGVFLAGDWVGSKAMLADCSFASAARAVELATAECGHKRAAA